MLFNSYAFLFVFLPVVLIGYLIVRRANLSPHYATVWLVATSLFFYSWWDVRFTALLCASIAVNYVLGRAIETRVAAGKDQYAKNLMITGVAANLGVLFFFKYLGFAVHSFTSLTGISTEIASIVLPLGISFFTFEQISYLVDVRRHGKAERNIASYAFFVSFFPRLVAGPILRASEILPQVSKQRSGDQITTDIAVGLSLFAIGLFKKTVLADGIAPYVDQIFQMSSAGEVDLLLGWAGPLAYTFQLYFDFSGYSDMAIGLAYCFGIKFPVNFFSPYKSTSIIEFWRRWHMTLSRFLRDYLYIALGGNRKGRARRYINLFATMLLGGLWHGANWTFVAWGALHGSYLMANHGWRAICGWNPALARWQAGATGTVVAWALTFIAVVVAWVFFRSTSFAQAWTILAAMSGAHGVALPSVLAAALPFNESQLATLGIRVTFGSGGVLVWSYAWILCLGVIALAFPNSHQLFRAYTAMQGDAPVTISGAVPRMFTWSSSPGWIFVTATAASIGILAVARAGSFLYWQF